MSELFHVCCRNYNEDAINDKFALAQDNMQCIATLHIPQFPSHVPAFGPKMNAFVTPGSH